MEQKQRQPGDLFWPPIITKYERARVIGLRALQLSLGAPPFVPVGENARWDPIDIAKRELEDAVLPLSIRRTMPDGRYVDIPIRELLKVSRGKESS